MTWSLSKELEIQVDPPLPDAPQPAQNCLKFGNDLSTDRDWLTGPAGCLAAYMLIHPKVIITSIQTY